MFTPVLRIACWLLTCEAVLVSSRSYVNDELTLLNTVAEGLHMEAKTRARRGSTDYDPNSKRPNFTDIASKIEDVINKIEPDRKEVAEFREAFQDIEDNYKLFHLNENSAKDFSVRSLLEDALSPVLIKMNQFDHGHCRLDHLASNGGIGAISSDIIGFIREFQTAKKKIAELPETERLTKVESLGPNGTLIDSENVKTPAGHSLRIRLRELASLYSSALKNDERETVVCTLAYGTSTFISKMLYSLDLLSFLADSFYENSDMELYNKYFNLLVSNFRILKNSIVESDSEDSIIQGLDKILPENVTLHLGEIKQAMESIELPLIVDIPERLIGKPDFEDQPIKTPLGQWVDGANVTYAIQYSRNRSRSRLGEWMDPITVSGEGNPILRIRVHPKRYERLVFRKFNNQKPQLVGILEDKYQTEFRDVNRDLYEAAARFDKKSMEEAEVLIKSDADVDAAFEGGRRAIHAAALSDNVQFARKFLIKSDSESNNRANAIDSNGYTPMHLASEAGNRRFIQFLLENGADANPRTYEKLSTPLHIAADRGFVSSVKALLKSKDIDVNAQDIGGFTPLHRAVSGGVPVLEVLMNDNRTDLQAKSGAGLTPLMLAVIEDYTDITEAQLSNSAVERRSKTNSNMTALAFASLLGNSEIIELLLNDELGADSEGLNGWAPLHFAVALKHTDAVDKMLLMNLTTVDSRTKNKITPLHIAVVTEQNKVTHNLIKRGAKIDEKTTSGLAPIHLALLFKNYKVFETLVNGGADLQAKSHDGSSLLHFAIANNKFDVIESLVKKGVDINSKNMITGETPLHTATRNGMLEVVEILVQHGVDVNAQNTAGQTPLHYVTRFHPANAETILNVLLDHNAQVNLKDESGRTALHQAVATLAVTTMVSALISNGADVNAKDYFGSTPLHLCAENDTYVNAAKFLLDHGAYTNPTDSVGQSPLHIAVKRGQSEIVRTLLNRKASVEQIDRNSQTPVHLTVVHDRERMLEEMLSQRSDQVLKTIGSTYSFSYSCSCENRNYYGGYRGTCSGNKNIIMVHPKLNPLQLAIALNRSSMVSLIKNYSSRNNPEILTMVDVAAATGNIDALSVRKPHNAVSSVCMAARYGHTDVVREFLGDGSYSHDLILEAAICCAFKHKNVVEMLINTNFDVDVNCTNGLTPLQNAARAGNSEVVKLLIKHKYHDPDLGNQKLLQAMVENGRMDVAKGLIDRGTTLNVTALGGTTLLHIVSQAGPFSEVKRLVDDGHSVNTTTKLRQTPLHFAAKGGNIDVIEYLMDKTADTNAGDYRGWTPLFWALDSRIVHLSVVKSLVEHGGSVNHKCSRGKTPLHIAVGGRASLEVIQYLLNKGADVNARDLEGNTPVFDAIRTGNLETIKMIVEAGAVVAIRNNFGASPLHYISSIQNGGFPMSDEPGEEYFQHLSLRTMDIFHYLKEQGAGV